MWYLIAALVLALPVFFIWAFIHEHSHRIALEKTVGLESYEIYPYPRKVKGYWQWAGISYIRKRDPSFWEAKWIHLAPRIPDLVAVLMFPLAIFMQGSLSFAWVMFWGGGLVDLVVGSLAITPRSDLVRAADGNKLVLWGGRIGGLFLVGFVTLLTFLQGGFSFLL